MPIFAFVKGFKSNSMLYLLLVFIDLSQLVARGGDKSILGYYRRTFSVTFVVGTFEYGSILILITGGGGVGEGLSTKD